MDDSLFKELNANLKEAVKVAKGTSVLSSINKPNCALVTS
jgi:hypothetical protein